MTPRRIGIVACSAEGAALCYRTICVEGAAILSPHAHPEVTVHTFSLTDYMAWPEERDEIAMARKGESSEITSARFAVRTCFESGTRRPNNISVAAGGCADCSGMT
jgi:hypothetical protein